MAKNGEIAYYLSVLVRNFGGLSFLLCFLLIIANSRSSLQISCCWGLLVCLFLINEHFQLIYSHIFQLGTVSTSSLNRSLTLSKMQCKSCKTLYPHPLKLIWSVWNKFHVTTICSITWSLLPLISSALNNRLLVVNVGHTPLPTSWN